MDTDLLLTVIKDIVVPELTSFIHSKFNATGELPTQTELQAAVTNLTTRIVMKSEAFINELAK